MILTVTTVRVFFDRKQGLRPRREQHMKRPAPPWFGEEGPVILGSEPPREPRLARRVLRWFGGALLWLLTLAPGSYILLQGVSGIVNKRLAGRWNWHVLYGADAVGFGWVTVGVGFWALGQFCYLKTSRIVVKLLGWALAVIAGVIGVWVLVKELAEHSGG